MGCRRRDHRRRPRRRRLLRQGPLRACLDVRLRALLRGRVFGLAAPRRRPYGVAVLAATGCWRDRPEGGLRRDLVRGSGLRRRSSRRDVAEATARGDPQLLLALPPVAPLSDLGRGNETDQPTSLGPPRPPHPTRTFRDRSRHKKSRRGSLWLPLFRCLLLMENFAKTGENLQEVLYLARRHFWPRL